MSSTRPTSQATTSFRGAPSWSTIPWAPYRTVDASSSSRRTIYFTFCPDLRVMSLPWRRSPSQCLRMFCRIDPLVGLSAPTPSKRSIFRRCSTTSAVPCPLSTPSPRPPTTDFLSTRPKRTGHGGDLGPRNSFGPIPRSNGSNTLSRSSSRTRPRDFALAGLFIHMPVQGSSLSGRIGLHYLGGLHIIAPHQAVVERNWKGIGSHALEGGYQGCLG